MLTDYTNAAFTKKQFCLDGCDTLLDGYSYDGDYWNGWSCPYLTFESMLKIQEMASDGEYWNIVYRPESDDFLFFDLMCGDTEWDEQFPIEAVTINGHKLYRAVDLSWTFVDADDVAKTF